MALNATTTFLAAREALRWMIDQPPDEDGQRGSIVLMSSVTAFDPSPRWFATHAYAAAKAAVTGLMRTTAGYYADHGIRVNALAPATVDTPMAARAARDAATVDHLKRKQPLAGGLDRSRRRCRRRRIPLQPGEPDGHGTDPHRRRRLERPRRRAMMRTTVIGSYPLPGWLLYAIDHLDEFGPADRAELQDDAVVAAIHDQVAAGLDVITDGEQTRLDFNLSFYGFLAGIELEGAPPRRFGPPAHDQRGRHQITGELAAPEGLGVVDEFERLRRLAPEGPTLKASVPGPYTMSGRLVPNADYPRSLGGDRGAAADRPGRAGGPRRRRLRRDHRRRAVDELLRLPRGP